MACWGPAERRGGVLAFLAAAIAGLGAVAALSLAGLASRRARKLRREASWSLLGHLGLGAEARSRLAGRAFRLSPAIGGLLYRRFELLAYGSAALVLGSLAWAAWLLALRP